MKITRYETNKDKNLYFNKEKKGTRRNWFFIDRLVVNVYPEVTYQKFEGFGACITEAAAYSYSLLPEEKKKAFMEDMFKNINYSLCRLTIGSCDFALSTYAYAKKHDLSDFSIEKDKRYIIPFIKEAL